MDKKTRSHGRRVPELGGSVLVGEYSGLCATHSIVEPANGCLRVAG